jgi:hypothetical protein
MQLDSSSLIPNLIASYLSPNPGTRYNIRMCLNCGKSKQTLWWPVEYTSLCNGSTRMAETVETHQRTKSDPEKRAADH